MSAKVRRVGSGPEFATPVRVVATGAATGVGTLDDFGDLTLPLTLAAAVTGNSPGAVLSAASTAAQTVAPNVATPLNLQTAEILDGPIFSRLSNTRFRANLPYPVRFDVKAIANYAGTLLFGTSRTLSFGVYRNNVLVKTISGLSGSVANANSVSCGGSVQLQNLDEIELAFQHDTFNVVATINVPVPLDVSQAALYLSQVATSPEQAVQTAQAAAAQAVAAVGQINAAAAGIAPPAGISRGRNTAQGVSGNAAWTTVLCDVAVFEDATYFSYEAGTGSFVPNTVDQERFTMNAIVRFAASNGGSYREIRIIAVNPTNEADFVSLLNIPAVPSATVDSVLQLNNVPLPQKNWKIRLQARHDYSIVTVPQNIDITGAVMTIQMTRGKQGPPGVAVRETVRTYNFTAIANQTDFDIPDAFDQVMTAVVGGAPQSPSDYSLPSAQVIRFDAMPVNTRVIITTITAPPGQASLLRLKSGTLAAGTTQIGLDEPLDIVLSMALGGIVQAPVADFNPNYQANRVDMTSSLAYAAKYIIAYRRTAP